MVDQVAISTVTPVYKGQDYVGDLIAALDELRQGWMRDAAPMRLIEAIFVVDDAVDESERVLNELAERYDFVRVIVLSRNFGQHAATLAGILYSSGDWVVTLDEDLQHHPRHIPELLAAAVQTGRDVVYAHPERDPHASGFRNLSSRGVKRLIGWLSRNPAIRNFNSYRLVRGTLARAAASLAGPAAYLDMTLCYFTSRIRRVSLPLKDPRVGQGSGYTLLRLIQHGGRLVMSAQLRGIKSIMVLSVLAMVLAVVGFAAVVWLRVFHPDTIDLQGWASIMLAILLFGGATTLVAATGLAFTMGVYQVSMGRPLFFVTDRSSDQVLNSYFARHGSDPIE